MKRQSGNLFANIPEVSLDEDFLNLVSSEHVRIERIVSTGQSTPAEEWLVQNHSEWVIVLQGSARLRIEDEDAARILELGDYVNIPAGCRHRVEWTSTNQPTIWIAVHY